MTGPLDVVGYVAAAMYALTMIALAVYGLHSLWLVLVHRRHAAPLLQREIEELAELPPAEELPRVLVQVPVFNERDVVSRIVEAVGELDWPHDLLAIQLLDDSTDDSVAIGAEAIARLQQRGLNAEQICREDRSGFKAGALEVGMAQNDAPFIAIFDADFVPQPDFLKRAIVPLLQDSQLALVQGRWAHLNRTENILTKAQAIGIDGHFAVEQGARAGGGLLMNFNGTCGLWRRAAIIDAGGWQHDTLTEDLDLSYRAQLRGWTCTYRQGIAVPGELPNSVGAWRSQQFRWAKGSMQTARKLLPRLWRATIPLHHKVAATLHLTHYAVHPLMVTSLVTAPVALWLCPAPPMGLLMVGLLAFVLGVVSPIAMYTYGQVMLNGRGGWRWLRSLPSLAAIGTGIAISNSRAVCEAWQGVVSPFVRTPKSGSGSGSYRAQGCTGIPELIAGAWAIVGISLCVQSGRPWLVPLLTLYASGFWWVGFKLAIPALRHAWQAGRTADQWVSTSVLSLTAVVSLAGYLWLGLHPSDWRSAPLNYALVGLGIGALYILSIVTIRYRRAGSIAFAIILCAGLGYRVAALGLAPSDDLNRYVVEGRQLAYGQNPYAVAPGDEAAQELLRPVLDHQIIDGVNHPDWTAIYPPVALTTHLLVTHADSHIITMKYFYGIVEIVAMFMALALLLRIDGNPIWWLVAWWNPVGPLWFAGEGHNDALMVALLLAGLLLASRQQRSLAIVATSCAALVKPFAVLALPLLLRGARWHLWLLPPAIAAVAYLPFSNAGMGLFQSLGRFGSEMSYHGVLEPLLHAVATRLFDPDLARHAVTFSLVGLLALGGLIVMRRKVDTTAELYDQISRLFVLLLVCLPTIHPWYMLLAVTLLPVMSRSRGAILWTAIMPVYWLHGLAMIDNNGQWTEDQMVTMIAHLPVLVFIIYDLFPREFLRWRWKNKVGIPV